MQAAHLVQILVELVIGAGFHRQYGAVGLQRLVEPARSPQGVAHVMRTIAEAHKVVVTAWEVPRGGASDAHALREDGRRCALPRLLRLALARRWTLQFDVDSQVKGA